MTELYRIIDGEPMISAAGMALLHGITVEALTAEMTRQRQRTGEFKMPTEWVRQGRRIAREAMAATGSTSMRDAIDYLALVNS